MKYIKKYENINTPEVGDFILIKEILDHAYFYTRFNNYLHKYIIENIGQIRKILKNNIIVDYYEKPFYECRYFFTYHEENNSYSIMFDTSKYNFISGSMDDIKITLDSEKYNL